MTARARLIHGDCLAALETMPTDSVDAVVTDPPYGLVFMGKEWDRFAGAQYQDWCLLWATECLRVLKPGGHLLAFGGTRTSHRLASAIEDAGFEIRDSIAWLYGSGFPKSLDVSKAIDKAAGAQREVVGTKLGQPGYSLAPSNNDHRTYSKGLGNTSDPTRECEVTAPATDAAQQWAGWGTALKPGYEPIVVARKPFRGTVAANVVAHGTGALNVDACRVGNPAPSMSSGGTRRSGGIMGASSPLGGWENTASGRWPTNVVMDESQAAELDAQSGITAGGHHPATRNGIGYGSGAKGTTGTPRTTDSGGASRFFPVFKYQAKASAKERPKDAEGKGHPTVKPLELMRWLVRLVTPPDGLVVDPFAGSGTTGEACLLEGFRCVLIEREADYMPLIAARLDRHR
jgi:site-specific DNA-methyltransferase (adenine-specific)